MYGTSKKERKKRGGRQIITVVKTEEITIAIYMFSLPLIDKSSHISNLPQFFFSFVNALLPYLENRGQ